MIKKLIFGFFALLILSVVFAIFNSLGNTFKRTENLPGIVETISPKDDDSQKNKDIPKLSVLAKNLEIPWSLVFLPDNRILFTERSGTVHLIDQEGKLQENPTLTISQVKHIGEGGLLGIELHPDFSDNGFVYLYYTYGENNGNTLNRVSRYKFDGETLTDAKVIVEAIPGAANHNGGRIKFGPDKFLYITTGDAQEPSRSQDTSSLAGKILRVTYEGLAAGGNPFNNQVYSFGHRNPQGITWDSNGRLWATEHGRSGALSGLDELNLIEAGKNYGWDIIQGDEKQEGMVTPIIHSGSSTWAPSGAVFYDGSIYFTGLRGVSLYEYEIENKKLTRHLNGELGRIRDVVKGPGGMLFIATSNRDGRGVPSSDDDKIIRVNPQKL